MHSYLNYGNIAWASTNKSNYLISPYQKHQLGLLTSFTYFRTYFLYLSVKTEPRYSFFIIYAL